MEKALQELAYKQSPWQVFTDFLDFSLLMLRWWDVKEEMFEDLKSRYPDTKQHHLFAEAYMAMADVARGGTNEVPGNGFNDPFGDYFMEHFSNDRSGQFFTPEHVCDLMAELTYDKNRPQGVTVCDPCCGSSRMLLSAAKIDRRDGHRNKYYAADLDITCVKMTLINFMLNTMPGEVAHMNTISTEIWKAYKVMLIPYGDHMIPQYLEIHPEQSSFKHYNIKSTDPKPEIQPLHFTPTPITGKAVQQSLFS